MQARSIPFIDKNISVIENGLLNLATGLAIGFLAENGAFDFIDRNYGKAFFYGFGLGFSVFGASSIARGFFVNDTMQRQLG